LNLVRNLYLESCFSQKIRPRIVPQTGHQFKGKGQKPGMQLLPHTNKRWLGPGFVVLSGFAFAFMGALIKYLSPSLPSEVIVFFRSLIGIVVVVPLLLRQKVSMRTGVPHLHLLRGVVGFGAMYTFFYSISLIPLSQAVLLSYTTPLFAPVIAWLWLREGMGLKVWGAILTGFLGVVFLLHPKSGTELLTVGGLIALSSGLLAAVALTTIRRMSDTEATTRIVFYHTFISLLASAVLAAISWQTPLLEQLLLLIAIGILATVGQMAITRGYSLAPVATAGPFTYTTVVFAAVMGAVFWGELFDVFTWGGSLLVIIGGILALRAK